MRIPFFNTPKAVVARGARFLDRKIPDWRDHVNIEILTTASTSRCVLGQLNQAGKLGRGDSFALNGYYNAITALNHPSQLWENLHGFNTSGENWQDLDWEWRKVIAGEAD